MITNYNLAVDICDNHVIIKQEQSDIACPEQVIVVPYNNIAPLIGMLVEAKSELDSWVREN